MAADPRGIAASLRIEAIAIGAAITVAIGYLSTLVTTFMPFEENLDRIDLLLYAMQAIALVGDIAGGFAAGWIARRLGAVHGALANVLATVVGLALGAVMTLARGDGMGLGYLASAQFWLQFIGWATLGLLLAALAGFIAAKVRGDATA